jgi:hypothetical protein
MIGPVVCGLKSFTNKLTDDLGNRSSAMRSRVEKRIFDSEVKLETPEGCEITNGFL